MKPAVGSPRTQDESASAFIDLVGTRDRAKASADTYADALERFNRRLIDVSSLLSASGHIFFFSDCAFISCSSMTGLCDFMVRLRYELFLEALFFKAALAAGGLEPQAPEDEPGLSDKKRNEVRSVLKGYFFSKQAADLYSQQERLKGIGIHVSPGAAKGLRRRITSSCYLPDVGTPRAVAYDDLTLGREELKPQILDAVIRECYAAKARSRKLGRYYLSLLILWARSENLSDLSRRDDSFIGMLVAGRLDRLLGDLAGSENLYAAVLDRLHHEQETIGMAAFDEAVSSFMKRQRFRRGFESIPDAIFSQAARVQCFQRASRLMIGPARGARERKEAGRPDRGQ